MDDYMPSTEQVRSHYVFNQSDQWVAERGKAFDRWLTVVAALAWQRGYYAGRRDEVEDVLHPADNPYWPGE